MATYTENYGLHQWESGDDFLREDFNEDFEKIDTAIKAVEEDVTEAMTEGLATKCEVVFGTYDGDGAASREIVLGFKPKAVIVEIRHGFRGDTDITALYGGIILEDSPIIYSNNTAGTITDNGFEVYYGYSTRIYTNRSDYSYHYIAFK